MCRKKPSWDSSWCPPYHSFWASRISAFVGGLNCTSCTRWACIFSEVHPRSSASALYWLPWAWSHQLHQWAACATCHSLCGRNIHVLTTMYSPGEVNMYLYCFYDLLREIDLRVQGHFVHQVFASHLWKVTPSKTLTSIWKSAAFTRPAGNQDTPLSISVNFLCHKDKITCIVS